MRTGQPRGFRGEGGKSALIELDYAGTAALTPHVSMEIKRVAELLSQEPFPDEVLQNTDRVRNDLADMVGGYPRHIALVQSAAHGMAILAGGLRWRMGDNVVVVKPHAGFTASLIPWTDLAQIGVEVRVVEPVAGRIEYEAVGNALNRRSRVLVSSHVDPSNGWLADLNRLKEAVADDDTLVAVDGSFAVGVLACRHRLNGIDLYVADAHRWLLGPRGIGFGYFSDRLLATVEPSMVGTESLRPADAAESRIKFKDTAARYEVSYPAALDVAGLAAGLRNDGRPDEATTQARTIARVRSMLDAALSLGYQTRVSLHGDEPRPEQGPVVYIRDDGRSGRDLARLALSSGIRVGASGDHIRVAPHYMTSDRDEERFIHFLQSARPASSLRAGRITTLPSRPRTQGNERT